MRFHCCFVSFCPKPYTFHRCLVLYSIFVVSLAPVEKLLSASMMYLIVAFASPVHLLCKSTKDANNPLKSN